MGTVYANRGQLVQVQVGAPLKLLAFVNGQQVSDGSVFETAPSDFLTNNFSSNEIVGGGTAQPKYIEVLCWDDGAQDYVKGCQYQIQGLAPGAANGGHLHGRSDAPLYLTGTETALKYDGGLHSVDNEGGYTTDRTGLLPNGPAYWAPIEAGEVKLNLAGFDKDGNSITAPPPIVFRMKQPGLVEMTGDTYRFKCTPGSTDPACPGGGYQHTDFYNVTPAVNATMSKIATDYDTAVPSDRNDLVVTDASLAWGGLYDIGEEYGYSYWSSPHAYHRQGTDIDIRRTTIASPDKFKDVVCRNGGYPFPEDSAHFHLFFYVYGYTDYIVGLCPNPEVGPQ